VRPPGARGRAVAFTGTIVVSLTVFAVLAIQIDRRRPPALDERIIDFVARHQNSHVSRLVDFLLAAGGEPHAQVPLVFLLAAILLLSVTRRSRDAYFLAAAVGGALIFAPLLKLGFERPPLENDTSTRYFPSGHATGSFVVIAALVLICWSTRLRCAALGVGLLFVPLYGAALVYSLGHYPSDVVAGWSIGLAWVTALYAVRVACFGPTSPRRG
jgi:membrane-associated phospholipid phosphatase